MCVAKCSIYFVFSASVDNDSLRKPATPHMPTVMGKLKEAHIGLLKVNLMLIQLRM
jgi:hypothetical protein